MALHFVSTSVLTANKDGHGKIYSVVHCMDPPFTSTLVHVKSIGQYNEEVMSKEAEALKKNGQLSAGTG